MRWLAVIALVLATDTTGQELANGPGLIKAFGIGIRSCATWLDDPGSEISGSNWILGYWTGMNTNNNTNHAVGDSTDALGIISEIKKLCTEKPSLTLSEAAEKTYWFLYYANR